MRYDAIMVWQCWKGNSHWEKCMCARAILCVPARHSWNVISDVGMCYTLSARFPYVLISCASKHISPSQAMKSKRKHVRHIVDNEHKQSAYFQIKCKILIAHSRWHFLRHSRQFHVRKLTSRIDWIAFCCDVACAPFVKLPPSYPISSHVISSHGFMVYLKFDYIRYCVLQKCSAIFYELNEIENPCSSHSTFRLLSRLESS